ncbi:MAG: hypothetical protein ACK5NB_04955 [Flavobacteriaceae bacterium]
MKSKLLLLLMSTLLMVNVGYSQSKNDKAKTKKEKRLSARDISDSVFMSKPYPFILPVLGDKAHDRGYRFPLPFGVMFNSISIDQKMMIDNMRIGFGNTESGAEPVMYDIDGIVAFNPVEAQTVSRNVRVDVWPFPFLNVYGIYGKMKKSDINIEMTAPFPLKVTTDIAGHYFGYGAMLNGKIGPVFVSLDANKNVNHNPRLDKPVAITLVSLRSGPIFSINRNPNMKIMFWTGLMHSHFNAATNGSISTKDLAPNASSHIANMQTDMDNWYSGLKPLDRAKYAILYNTLSNGLTALDESLETSYIKYKMDKTVDRPWNMLMGIQWQINQNWQMRTEAQILGDRSAWLFSFNYRFGINGKTWFSKGE